MRLKPNVLIRIMRLYLSSFDLGDRPKELVALAHSGRRAAIIVNALDNLPESRSNWLESQTDRLTELGFNVVELDLREYFDDPTQLEARLKEVDIVWINGGNSFILRRAMRQSGFDTLIKNALANDEIVYAGFSAAAVIVSNSLRGLELVDDPEDIPPGYDPAVIWDGLGLLPFAIAVHLDSNHLESEALSREIAFYETEGISYQELRDGEVLIIDGDKQKIAGAN
jgi:dipeptidase E